ncbi:MAG: hypothetical protein OXI53_10370 [Nitrospira sp.]|nr:hypothetical protein [Nitrospira sp.]MDE0485614.1 hypothetical protein [Nitrospira sp.]
MTNMINEQILVMIISSLLSGLIGVAVSSWFYARLEKRKMKMETARKMFGSRHDISSTKFQESLNEIMIIFSDSQEIIEAVENSLTIAATPQSARAPGAENEVLIKLMKAVCQNIGIKQRLSDAYYLKYFFVSKHNT